MAFRQKQINQIRNKLLNSQSKIENITKKLNDNSIEFDKENLEEEIQLLKQEDEKLVGESKDKKKEIENLHQNIKDNHEDITTYKKKIIIEKNNYDNTYNKESKVYKNEINRIKTNMNAFLENKQKLLDDYLEKKIKIFNDLESKKNEIINIKNYLTKYNESKIEVRNSYVELMMIHNKEKKQLHKEHKQLNDELDKLNSDINRNDTLINNYNTYKFKINKEHYEWKEDINKTNEQIISLFKDLNLDVSTYVENNELNKIDILNELSNNSSYSDYEKQIIKRIDILVKYLNDIQESDIRKDTLSRYNSLEKDYNNWKKKRSLLNENKKQLISKINILKEKQKGTKYIMNACNQLNVNKEEYIFKKKRIEELKIKIKEIEILYNDINDKVDIEKEIIDNKKYPENYLIEEKRCEQRKTIILERIEKKYIKNKAELELKIDNKLKENNEISTILSVYEEMDVIENENSDFNDLESKLKEEREDIAFKICLKSELLKLIKIEEQFKNILDKI